ncbi:DUF805 domain-containing protein [Campylobacter ureolyticus]|uniref:DUF805 domain-containing protein n=1 Tax=Campylobacter ureolyticus TaxID=827 RepID=UPI0004689340|nr:DUF805 domain-containing protein [Campylobacter ureolyticus]
MNYFDEYYLGAFRKFATFSGRARRKEYSWFLVFNFIVGIIISVVDFLAFGDSDGFFSLIYALVVFIPGLAVLVRRLHDFGKSGWFVLVIIFAPTIALIVGLLFIQTSKELGMLFLIIALALFFYFVFLPIFKKGDEGENAYGSDPKALNL